MIPGVLRLGVAGVATAGVAVLLALNGVAGKLVRMLCAAIASTYLIPAFAAASAASAADVSNDFAGG